MSVQSDILTWWVTVWSNKIEKQEMEKWMKGVETESVKSGERERSESEGDERGKIWITE